MSALKEVGSSGDGRSGCEYAWLEVEDGSKILR